MILTEVANYEEMSQAASDILLACIQEKPNALLCIATGSSPTRAYSLLVEKIRQQQVDTSCLQIVKLDEWCGLEKSNPATCEAYIQQHILQPLDISQDRYISFDPLEQNWEKECARITGLIEEKGGMDCCVLGIGKNGHLGLNEPGPATLPFAHKALLDEKTKGHSMLSLSSQKVQEGYTLGIQDILCACKVLLLVTGEGKKEACQNLYQPSLSSWRPANYLWLHKDAVCLVDQTCCQ